MLPIKNRLKKREDFAQIFAKGAYAGCNGFSIKYAKNSLGISRIGFPVGKNYSKKAVVRNRTRRILQAVCEKHLDILKPGFDIIILIKPTYKNIESKKVALELKVIFLKANLFI